jgi:hypothetical protein
MTCQLGRLAGNGAKIARQVQQPVEVFNALRRRMDVTTK